MNTDLLILLGIALIFLGFILLFLGLMSPLKEVKEETSEEMPQRKIKGGGVVLIGPIPIIFGSDYKYAIIAIVLAIILMLIVFLLII